MPRCLVVSLAVAIATLGVLFQLYYRPLAKVGRVGREPLAIANGKCTRDKSLQACDKLVLHKDSGLVYLACSTPYFRTLWLPSADHFNGTGAGHDYLAVYDPSSSKSTRLPLVSFDHERGLSVTGMDVVTSSVDPREIWVYVVNLRAPALTPSLLGPLSSVEIFKGAVGGKKLKWVGRVEERSLGLIHDIVGLPDGTGFYVTNDKFTVLHRWKHLFGMHTSTVSYCHVDTGCVEATEKLKSAKGIARGSGGEIYVGSVFGSYISVMEAQADNTLVLTDTIPVGEGALLGVTAMEDGSLYVVESPKIFKTIFKHLKDPKVSVPSAVLRITKNEGEGSFYGEKYRVERIFEDDGGIASGITTAAWDPTSKRLYMHGMASPAFIKCDI